jgi:predicted nuclease of predicted toxin-antitoxin system
MKFKLDENLGNRTRSLFEEAGFDVETVLSEQLVGCTDDVLFEVCKEEGRCLITLDLDFSDVVRYPPLRNPGIIVLRIAGSITLKNLEFLSLQILKGLQSNDPTGKLWIVEPGRIRIHRDETTG